MDADLSLEVTDIADEHSTTAAELSCSVEEGMNKVVADLWTKST